MATASKKNVGAESFQDVFDQIIFAHGDAAGQYQNVFMQAELDVGAEIFDAVGGVAKDDGFATGEANLRGQGDAVAVANLEWAGLRVDWDDFVAGGEDGHARFFCAAELSGADLRGES